MDIIVLNIHNCLISGYLFAERIKGNYLVGQTEKREEDEKDICRVFRTFAKIFK